MIKSMLPLSYITWKWRQKTMNFKTPPTHKNATITRALRLESFDAVDWLCSLIILHFFTCIFLRPQRFQPNKFCNHLQNNLLRLGQQHISFESTRKRWSPRRTVKRGTCISHIISERFKISDINRGGGSGGARGPWPLHFSDRGAKLSNGPPTICAPKR